MRNTTPRPGLRIPLRLTLISGLVLLAVGTGAVAWFGFFGVRNLNVRLARVQADMFERARLMAEARVALADMDRALLNHVLAETKPEMDTYEAAVRDHEANLLGRLSALASQPLTPGGQQVVDSVYLALRQMKPVRDRMLVLSAAGRDDEVRKTSQREWVPIVRQMDAAMAAFAVLQGTRLEREREEADSGYRRAVANTSVAAVGLLGLVLLVYVAAAGIVNRSLRDFVRGAREFSRGDFGYRVRSQAGREFSELAEAMNSMADERSRVELALHESRARLQLQMDRMPVACIVWSPEFRVTEWNPAAEQTFGFSREEVLGKHPYDLIVPRSAQPQVDAIWSRLLVGDSAAHSESENLTKDGRTILCYWTNTLLQDADGTTVGVLSMAQDITERTRAEAELHRYREHLEELVERRSAELRESEHKYRTLVERANDGICIIQGDVLRFVNRQFAEMLGYTVDELTGADLASVLPPGNMEYVVDRVRRRLAGETVPAIYETELRRRDGSPVPVEVSAGLVEHEGATADLKFLRDVSERKRAETELARTNEELVYSNAELERFAYVASHDLKEPLRKVASFTELLAERCRGRLDERADLYVAYIVDGARRMQRLIDDLLVYSRIGTRGKPFAPFALDEVVRRAIENLALAIEESGTKVVYGGLPVVLGDDLQLVQLFQNIIGNAVKFRSERTPEVRIGAERRGGEWVVSVEDNGIGIAPEYYEKIFEIFERLHGPAEYPGTGIGLAICRKVVERHGGRMWVESEPGRGATFKFTLTGEGGTDG